MANVDYFPVNKQQGDEGEAVIQRWLEQQSWDISPYSLQNDKQYHVDIEASGVLGQHALIDAKHDNWIGKTSNIPFEVNSSRYGKGKEKPGWGTDENVKAEYIFVVDMNQREQQQPQFWYFRLADLREYWQQHPDAVQKGNCAQFPLAEYGKEFCYYYVDNDWKQHMCGNLEKAWEQGEG